MRTFFHRLSSLLPLLVVAVSLSACGDLLSDDADSALTDAEAEVLAQFVADAVAEQPEGLMADVYDLTGDLGPDGILYLDEERSAERGRPPHAPNPDRPWRGGQGDFSVTYDPATGTHTVAYTREAEHRNFAKRIDATLQYVFTDADGGFIESPRQDRAQVADVVFNGTRSGESAGTRGRSGQLEMASSFTQDAAWTLTGVNTGAMTLVGSQTRSGTSDVTGEARSGQRAYTLSLRTDDLTLVAGDRASGTPPVVTGTIAYDLYMEKTVNGETEVIEESGTVELTGDEEARIRIFGLNRLFPVDLRTGTLGGDR